MKIVIAILSIVMAVSLTAAVALPEEAPAKMDPCQFHDVRPTPPTECTTDKPFQDGCEFNRKTFQ